MKKYICSVLLDIGPIEPGAIIEQCKFLKENLKLKESQKNIVYILKLLFTKKCNV